MKNRLSLNQLLAQALGSLATINTFDSPRSNGLFFGQRLELGPTTQPLYIVKTDLSVCNLQAPIEPIGLNFDPDANLSISDYNMSEADILVLELGKSSLA
ncbi:hypothetical protein AWZ03_001327 [Drosophila navojoa]|uniref:Uncharacterized protein n=1 Tax=Drosophila navojoa TaxID=7232 RepID=A0A484BTA8_DRONA|nr:hypothetical protein AWZ03_001327 [Drosophila navojoa]